MVTLQQQLLRLNCRLVRLDADQCIVESASGFIIERNGLHFLLSAGHVFQEDGWCLETDVRYEDTYETLLICLTGVITFHIIDLNTMEAEDLEFAYALLDIERLTRMAQNDPRLNGKPIRLASYRGPLDIEPSLVKAEYCFASLIPRASYTKLLGGRYRVDRELTAEYEMTYEGRSSDGKLYHFRLAGAHRGHKYYEGASGSPIADSEGKVVSLLLGGNTADNTLQGLPLADWLPLLDMRLQCTGDECI